MSKLTDTQPDNLNQLSVVGFDVNFSRLPNTEYFCQRVNIPAVVLGETAQANPFMNTPLEGDTLTFESLSISFVIDEDMQNYIEIYNWLTALGFPKDYTQFAALKRTENFANEKNSFYSDINIIMHTNKSNPNYSITFTDVFPTALSSVQLDSTVTTVEPLVVDATFNFRGQFDINKLV
tara:strand:- start:6343 stop:6879 length:537 start_codon:yes stop_codon:yes gene_type:complete